MQTFFHPWLTSLAILSLIITSRASLETYSGSSGSGDSAPGNVVLNCDFENSDCDFFPSNEWSSWVRCSNVDCPEAEGATDHTTGQDGGTYFVMPFYNSEYNFSMLEWQLPSDSSADKFCLTYWYKVVGKLLFVETGYGQGWPKTYVWERKVSESDSWTFAEMEIDSNRFFEKNFIGFGGARDSMLSGYFAIDDVVIYEGSCQKRLLECNFEFDETFCNTTSVSVSGHAEWSTNHNRQPNRDHTLQTWYGNYAYVSNDDHGDFTTLFKQPHILDMEQSYCLQFWYRLGPITKIQNIDLDVYINNREDDNVMGISLSPQDMAWNYFEADIPPRTTENVTLVLEARYQDSDSERSEITADVDDIIFLPGSCSKLDKCTFETNTCKWSESVTFGGKDWIRGTANDGGPVSFDNTLRTSEGYYMYATPEKLSADIDIGPNDFSHWMSTDRLIVGSVGCLRFFYQLSTEKNTTLRLLATTNAQIGAQPNLGKVVLWEDKAKSEEVNPKNHWVPATVPIVLDGAELILYFRASGANGSWIAIDDIHFDPHICKTNPPDYRLEKQNMIRKTVDCYFTDNLCKWTAFAGAKFSIQDDELDGVASATYKFNATSPLTDPTLYSPIVPGYGAAICLEFIYAFHGSSAALVRLEPQYGNVTVYWARQGSQGYKYNIGYTKFDWLYDRPLQFAFSSSTPGTFSIRSIEVFFDDCPQRPDNFCDFEINSCGWDVPDWEVNSWVISAGLTDEIHDHTTETKYGHVFKTSGLIESVNTLRKDVHISEPTDVCISFWFNMGDQSSASPALSLVVRPFYLSDTTEIFSYNADTLKYWQFGYASFNADPKDGEKLELIFNIANSTEDSYTGLDDIEVIFAKCPNPINCGWEESTCSYKLFSKTETINTVNRWATWISPSSYGSPESNIPEIDRTTGTKFGHFIYVDAIKFTTADIIEYALLESAKFHGTDKESCIDIWYQLSGDFELTVLAGGSMVTAKTDTSGNWNMLQVEIAAGEAFNLYIGVWGKKQFGFVAIDDIIFHENTQCGQPAETTTLIQTSLTTAITADTDETTKSTTTSIESTSFSTTTEDRSTAVTDGHTTDGDQASSTSSTDTVYSTSDGLTTGSSKATVDSSVGSSTASASTIEDSQTGKTTDEIKTTDGHTSPAQPIDPSSTASPPITDQSSNEPSTLSDFKTTTGGIKTTDDGHQTSAQPFDSSSTALLPVTDQSSNEPSSTPDFKTTTDEIKTTGDGHASSAQPVDQSSTASPSFTDKSSDQPWTTPDFKTTTDGKIRTTEPSSDTVPEQSSTVETVTSASTSELGATTEQSESPHSQSASTLALASPSSEATTPTFSASSTVMTEATPGETSSFTESTKPTDATTTTVESTTTSTLVTTSKIVPQVLLVMTAEMESSQVIINDKPYYWSADLLDNSTMDFYRVSAKFYNALVEVFETTNLGFTDIIIYKFRQGTQLPAYRRRSKRKDSAKFGIVAMYTTNITDYGDNAEIIESSKDIMSTMTKLLDGAAQTLLDSDTFSSSFGAEAIITNKVLEAEVPGDDNDFGYDEEWVLAVIIAACLGFFLIAVLLLIYFSNRTSKNGKSSPDLVADWDTLVSMNTANNYVQSPSMRPHASYQISNELVAEIPMAPLTGPLTVAAVTAASPNSPTSARMAGALEAVSNGEIIGEEETMDF